MNIVFSDMRLDFLGASIFLAGPTPRDSTVPSWRPEAIDIFVQYGYQGNLLIPERRDWKTLPSYEYQVEWEEKALSMANAIMFWMPRQLPSMPAFTSNVEFGRWIEKRGQRLVYGRPDGAPHTRYLDWLYEKLLDRVPKTTLHDTIEATILNKKYG